jgi:hypothetical protein
VNAKMIACSLCHGATVNSTGGTIDGHADDRHDTAGGRPDDQQSAPGKSDFGRSHKRDKKQNRNHDN